MGIVYPTHAAHGDPAVSGSWHSPELSLTPCLHCGRSLHCDPRQKLNLETRAAVVITNFSDEHILHE